MKHYDETGLGINGHHLRLRKLTRHNKIDVFDKIIR